MFWAHEGEKARILRSSMDGTDVQSIITSDISTPKSLSIDFTSSLLYWVDSKLDTIQYCNFKGENRFKL